MISEVNRSELVQYNSENICLVIFFLNCLEFYKTFLLQSVLTQAVYRQATRNSHRQWQYHMLHVYNRILLKMSTWGSKNVEENIILWINNNQCIKVVINILPYWRLLKPSGKVLHTEKFKFHKICWQCKRDIKTACMPIPLRKSSNLSELMHAYTKQRYYIAKEII